MKPTRAQKSHPYRLKSRHGQRFLLDQNKKRMFITFHQKQKFWASIELKDTQQAKPTTDELPDDDTKTAIFSQRKFSHIQVK